MFADLLRVTVSLPVAARQPELHCEESLYMIYRSPKQLTRTFCRSGRLGAAALLAALAMLMAGCAAAESPDTGQPEQSELATRLARVEAQLAQLTPTAPAAAATEAPTAAKTKAPTRTPVMPAANLRRPTPTAAPTPTATPIPAPPPVSADRNICFRNPAVTEKLLYRLKIASCQVVTGQELFRLHQEGLTIETGDFPLSPGDFAGLVNLTRLTVDTEAPIPAHAFQGLDNLRQLEIRTEDVSISAQALQALNKLEELTIFIRSTHAISMEHIEPGALDNLPSLEAITIRLELSSEQRERGRLSLVNLPPLGDLPRLKEIHLEGEWNIGPNSFANLPSLEILNVYGGQNEHRTIRLNQNSFLGTPSLKVIRLGGNLAIHRHAFATLHDLEGLSISRRGGSSDNRPELSLSPNSPLMREILNRNRSPEGYELIPPGAN